jgi:flagellar biosynthetic protein FliO
MEWVVAKMVLSLGAVLLLMYALVYALKRFVLPGAAGAHQQVPIDIIGRRVLQPKKSVVVMKVAGKVLVVGMTEHGMQTLAELAEEDLPARDRLEIGTETHPRAEKLFASMLQTTIQSWKKRNGERVHA